MLPKQFRTLTLCVLAIPFNVACSNDKQADNEPSLNPTSTENTSPFVCNQPDLSTFERGNAIRYALSSLVVVNDGNGGIGSGFFVDPSGHIVTNEHVVEDATDEITVTLFEHTAENRKGKTHSAKIIGVDARTDVALLKIDDEIAGDWPCLTMSTSTQVDYGDTVAAIGHPSEHYFSFNRGEITNPPLFTNDAYVNHIVSDVAINPGSSGGALLNEQFEVVGVNNAIFSKNRSYAGISYSIPSDVALKSLTEIFKNQSNIVEGWVGIDFVYNFISKPEAGAEIITLYDGSPAQVAGIETGDKIISYNGVPVSDHISFARAQMDTRPKDIVMLTTSRDGDLKTHVLVADDELVFKAVDSFLNKEDELTAMLGLLRRLNPESFGILPDSPLSDSLYSDSTPEPLPLIGPPLNPE